MLIPKCKWKHQTSELPGCVKKGKKYWLHLQGQPLVDNNRHSKKHFAILTDITDKILNRQKRFIETSKIQNEIADAVFIALEKERAEIGAEIHDNINHTLVAINYILKWRCLKMRAENYS